MGNCFLSALRLESFLNLKFAATLTMEPSKRRNFINLIKRESPRQLMRNNIQSTSVIYYPVKHLFIFYIKSNINCAKAVLYAFDIKQNKYFKLKQCPYTFAAGQELAIALNEDKDSIYLFMNGHLLCSYSMNRKKWKYYKKIPKTSYTFADDKIIYIPSPIEQFLLYNPRDNEWCKFNGNEKKISIKAHNLKQIKNINNPILMHASALKLVLIFGRHSNDEYDNDLSWEWDQPDDLNKFFVIKTDKMKNHRERFKEYKGLKLPSNNSIDHALIAFGHLLIVFISSSRSECLHDIWFLDLLQLKSSNFGKAKWHKSEKYMNRHPTKHIVFKRMLLTKENFIYAINGEQMICFHISEIMPKELQKSCQARFDKYVHGIIRTQIEQKFKMTIPYDLKWTIAAYFSPLKL